MLQELFYVLVSETTWLPNNATWNDVKYVSGDVGSNQGVMFLSLIVSLLLVGLHFGLRKICFVPLGNMLGIKNGTPKTVEDIPLLEEAFATHQRYSNEQIKAWSKQLDLNEMQVKQWLRLRSKIGKPGKLNKFCEYCFGLLYYSLIIPYGIYILWNSSYWWNIKECWNDYPNHVKSLSIWVYWILKLGFYFGQFVEVKRKYALQMYIHHLTSVALGMTLWITRFHRIGLVIALTHDATSIPLIAWKISVYARRKRVADICLGILLVTWIVSRLTIFPFWVVKSALMDWPGARLISPGYYVLNGFLLVLMVLHVYWTKLIVQHMFKKVKSENIRSESSN